jgi:hypothetical protein
MILPQKNRVTKGHPALKAKLLLDNFQNFHGASLGADAAGDALGNGIAFLMYHDLHGADLNTLAALHAQLLVDHVDTSLLVLGDCTVLTGLHALAALNADGGLGITVLGNTDLNGAEGHVKFLVECFGTSLNALQASHALSVFLNSELLHIKNPLCFFVIQKYYTGISKKMQPKKQEFPNFLVTLC